VQTRPGHWIRIKTVGARSNRDGFGAKIEVSTGGLTQYAEVRANASYVSASDSRTHFGVGNATTIDKLTIRWPSGLTDTIGAQRVDQELMVTEGEGVTSRRKLQLTRTPPGTKR
jgi:hypothetical protein